MSNGPIHYYSLGDYVHSADTLKQKISRVDQAIDKLEALLVDMPDREHIQQYSLDDGQTSISAGYKSSKDVEASIHKLERLRQRYIRRLTGGSSVLRDNDTFT